MAENDWCDITDVPYGRPDGRQRFITAERLLSISAGWQCRRRINDAFYFSMMDVCVLAVISVYAEESSCFRESNISVAWRRVSPCKILWDNLMNGSVVRPSFVFLQKLLNTDSRMLFAGCSMLKGLHLVELFILGLWSKLLHETPHTLQYGLQCNNRTSVLSSLNVSSVAEFSIRDMRTFALRCRQSSVSLEGQLLRETNWYRSSLRALASLDRPSGQFFENKYGGPTPPRSFCLCSGAHPWLISLIVR